MCIRMVRFWRSTCDVLTSDLTGSPSINCFFVPVHSAGLYFFSWPFWLEGVKHGVIAVPAGQGATSFVDARDIAASAVAALTSNAFDGKAYDLTGPQALSYAEAAAILGEVAGKPIRYKASTDTAFIAMLTGAGVPADYAAFLAMIFHPVREGWTARVTGDVEKLSGRRPTGLVDYARDHRAALNG